MVDKPQNQDIYICRCEEVTEQEIKQAIEDGARSIIGIKKRTYAGMGLCQGRTCSKQIGRMLSEKVPPADILPDTNRPPVRTLKIQELIEEDGQ